MREKKKERARFSKTNRSLLIVLQNTAMSTVGLCQRLASVSGRETQALAGRLPQRLETEAGGGGNQRSRGWWCCGAAVVVVVVVVGRQARC